MNKFKLKIGVILTLMTIIIFSITLTRTPKITATVAPFDKYNNPELGLIEASALYHKTVNEMFNKRIKLLIDSINNPQKSPESPDAACFEKSTRTYCLAMDALAEYDGYTRALLQRRKFFKDDTAFCSDAELKALSAKNSAILNSSASSEEKDKAEKTLKNIQALQEKSITGKTNFSDKRITFIDRELDISGKALDKALASYNELQVAYPMHKEYDKLIKNLQEYNKKLAEIRRDIELFPAKFIDASTTDCM